MGTNRLSLRLVAVLAAVVCAAAVSPAVAQRTEPEPPELRDVGVDEQLDAQLPLDATFTDSNGKAVTLGDYFDGEHPVILVPVYYSCPMLCGLTLNGLLETLTEMDWSAGEQFRIVTLSFDPRETHRLAKAKRQNLLKEYGRPGADQGWELLVGKEKEIRRVTDSVGFKFKWNPKRQEYVHVAALVVCTPDGRVSQYMYGIQYQPRTARLLLVDAAEGKIGSPLDQLLLFCFHYNSADGTYAPVAMRIMQAGGTLTLLVLAMALVPVWIRAARRKQRAAVETPAGTDGAP